MNGVTPRYCIPLRQRRWSTIAKVRSSYLMLGSEGRVIDLIDDWTIERLFRPPTTWLEERIGASPIQVGVWLLMANRLAYLLVLVVEVTKVSSFPFADALSTGVMVFVLNGWISRGRRLDQHRSTGRIVATRHDPLGPAFRIIFSACSLWAVISALLCYLLDLRMPLDFINRLYCILQLLGVLGLYCIAAGDCPPAHKFEHRAPAWALTLS